MSSEKMNMGEGYPGNGKPLAQSYTGFENEEEVMKLQDYLQIILRRKWIVLVSFLVVFLTAVVYTINSQPVYQAQATVLVNTQSKGQGGLLLFDPTGLGFAQNLNNELEILKSRSVANAVARELLAKKYYDNSQEILHCIRAPEEDELGREILSEEELTGVLIRTVEFEPVRDSEVIKIIAKSGDPRDAALIANQFARAYYERNLRMSRTRSKAAREFLEKQLIAKQEQLAKAEEALQRYMEQTGIVSVDDESQKVIEQLATVQAQYENVSIELESVKESLNFYRKQIARQEPNVARIMSDASDPYIRLLQEEIARLEVEKDITISQNPHAAEDPIYKEKLIKIDSQIDNLRKKLRKRTNDYLKSVLPGQLTDPAKYLVEVKQKIFDTQIQVQALEAKKKALAVVLLDYQKQFDRIPKRSIEFARLQRARLSAEKLYLLVEEKYQEATIAEQSQFGYIEIIDQAIVPKLPISPKIRMNLMLGALLGLGLGVGLVFLLEYLDVSIRTPEDLKRRGWQPLSVIPSMDSQMIAELAQNKENPAIDDHLIALLSPRSSVAEGYRRLRTNLQYARLDKPLKSFLVTSPNPKEGKTTTASNLAITFSQAGLNTLLVDTDLRRPAIHRLFGLPKEPGLTNHLFGQNTLDEITHKEVIPHLSVMTSGLVPPNPSEILAAPQTHELIDRLKSMYDLVIFDTAPVLAVTDASILATQVEGTLLIILAGTTIFDELEHSIEQLERVNAHILGVAMNNFDIKRAYGSYYGQYKSRYYGYYGYYTYGHTGGKKAKKKRTETS
ncbi:capsular exopolysaccharide family [Caldithrix abyssi DSM 13497]|uniref:non-specific protein-tyrosine kinase n=2 Tax=Caldithrix abyssi DSM 13497 TaxID=880073 RepID=H1XPL7_CALAY|nr:polysaccharide biosynthesis tyrosine autokinase [Caldithrix abyssi]EHO39938.1 capsular exopolysaccharide family [Caldithrix abyssi DSM 13497]